MTPEMHGLMTFAVIFLGTASVLLTASLILFGRAINLVWTANRRMAVAEKRWQASQSAYWAAHPVQKPTTVTSNPTGSGSGKPNVNMVQ